MAKNYELRKVWGIGPFKRSTFVASFESLNTAKHVMKVRLLVAKGKGKKLTLEIRDMDDGKLILRKGSR